jgi:hypothetical protein
VFLHLVGAAAHVFHSILSAARNIEAQFFMLGWERYKFNKNHIWRRCTKLVFLHPVGSSGDIVHSTTFGARHIDTLFFMPWWDQYEFHKIHTRTRYVELVFLHPVGSAGHIVYSGVSGHESLPHYFSCSGGTGTDSTKSASGHVTPNLCFCLRWDPWVT